MRFSAETSQPIDLLLSQVLMPGLTGRQIAEEIVARRPHTHVVYISAFSEKALARRKLIPPEAPLVSKPFTREDLLGTVGRVLASRASS
ncbi:MAG: response regulator [Gemmatimonadaceae bacterium]|nr:response regulator [Gemmatimonadaceae bacterium]MDQ3520569.1 response regulator [Gemmatimonadota bacterium]